MNDVSPDQKLWLKIIIGMVLGVIVGLFLSPHGDWELIDNATAQTLAPWIKLPGTLFLGLIQMVVIPLVICSIVLGITQSGELNFVKKIGWRIILYFVCTTFIAISIGMVLVHTIKPGEYIDQAMIQSFQAETLQSTVTEQKTFENLTVPDRIVNLIPINLAEDVVKKNLLQIVIASMVFGAALLTLGAQAAKPIIDLCESGQAVSMKIIGWAMALAPIAVFGLVCNITLKIGLSALIGMGIYMLTVILGLLCMIGVYIFIASSITRKSPLWFLNAIKETQLLAFSTSSSAATMPFTLKCAEEKLGVPPKIARFTIPLGATINMDGTAMYQAIAAVFLVQIFGELSGIELTTTELILLMITTVGASIGTPATPGVGIVVLATILTGIGLNPAAIGFILGVDRILDMCRTTVNVTGDLTATLVMQKLLK